MLVFSEVKEEEKSLIKNCGLLHLTC